MFSQKSNSLHFLNKVYSRGGSRREWQVSNTPKSFLPQKSSNRSNLINEYISICSGLVCPSVRVLVTVRLLREFRCARSRWRGVSRGGALINKWNKLSVYMTPCHLCACMQRFKKKRKAHGLVDRIHSLKSNLYRFLAIMPILQIFL